MIVTLADKTGTLDSKIWDTGLEDVTFKAGEVVSFTVAIEEYKGQPQGKILGRVENIPHVLSDFVKASVYDEEEMWESFAEYRKSFSSPYFNLMAINLFDEECEAKFRYSPAATGMHHAFVHGLLEHTLQMLQCGQALLKLKFMGEALNKDLCMFGLMFHDFGKIFEYSSEPGFKKTTQGLLVPHIPMMAARIFETANSFGIPEEVRDHMMHVVLAHHRRLEWGSPVTFSCPEAAFVHYVDNLHGDVFGMIQKREDAKEDSIKYGFGSDTCNILKKPFNQILAELASSPVVEDIPDGF